MSPMPVSTRARSQSGTFFTKKEKEAKRKKRVRGGLWKLPQLWKSAEKRGFPQLLGKASQNPLGFPTVTTGPAAVNINHSSLLIDLSHRWGSLHFFAVQRCSRVISEMMPWMPWCHPQYSYDESQSWIDTQVAAFTRHEAFAFGIFSDDGSYLGGCGLNQIDQGNRRANLGYWVRSTVTGRGVATAATRLLRDWGFENCDLIRLELVIAVGNLASQRVAEKAGAIREGILRNRLVLHGQPHDAVMFSFVR